MIDAPCCSLPAPGAAYTNQRLFLDGIECRLLVQISSVGVPLDTEHSLKKSKASKKYLGKS